MSLDIIGGNTNRIHIRNAEDWGKKLGTDYWLFPYNRGWKNGEVNQLENHGWACTNTVDLAPTSGSTLFDQVDLINAGYIMVPNAQFITSPPIFGAYQDAWYLESVLGVLPTKICAEFMFRHINQSNNEVQSGLGFGTGTTAMPNANGHVAFIYTNGTNMRFRSGDNDILMSPTVADGTLKKYRIELSAAGGAEVFVDDISRGSIALIDNMFPCSFVASCSGSNNLLINTIHIWYV